MTKTIGSINIQNNKDRAAVVRLLSITESVQRKAVDGDLKPVLSSLHIVSTANNSPETIAATPAGIVNAMIDGDPEIDLRFLGAPANGLSRVLVDAKGVPARDVRAFTVKRDPEGIEKDRRERVSVEANINVQNEPVRLINTQAISVNDLLRKYVIRMKLQLAHVDDLTYDFLHALASYLQHTEKAVMVGGGPRGRAPLTIKRNGLPHFGFLTGEVDGDSYTLLLHLSNQELREGPK